MSRPNIHIDIMFVCRDRKHKSECFYHSKDGDNICQHDSYDDMDDLWSCNNNDAKIAALTAALEELGVKVMTDKPKE